jgi:hypothetical protein
VVLPILYDGENWPLILRGKHRLRVFENRVLRRIFGSKWDEILGGWRKLYNEGFYNFYYSPGLIR